MSSAVPSSPAPSLDQFGRRRLLMVVAGLGFYVTTYALAAGLNASTWVAVYTGLALMWMFVGLRYVLRVNPQALNLRGRKAEKQPRWDRILLAFYSPAMWGIYFIAGLDDRFGWTTVPLWLHIVCAVLLPSSHVLLYAAVAHNRYLSVYVEVTPERGHQVETQGPYRFIRHPMYASMVVTWPAVGLLLDSWWAAACGALATTLLVLRTFLEDRTLQANLPGYMEYAGRVRYRLIPGIW